MPSKESLTLPSADFEAPQAPKRGRYAQRQSTVWGRVLNAEADIWENTILGLTQKKPSINGLVFDSLLEILLLDWSREILNSSNTPGSHSTIVWATDLYLEDPVTKTKRKRTQAGFRSFDQMKVRNITDRGRSGARAPQKLGRVIQPRALKDKVIQQKRVKEKAEVFTPSWVCNVQNNLVDEVWFGRKNVFNLETEQGRSWQPTEGVILFPEGKTWQSYVAEPRMEMCCGEAPYLVSRYDTTTGQMLFPLRARIGLFDRKMRVVSENTKTIREWLRYAFIALQSTYGFEWQGDSLLIARENLFFSFCEYYDEFCRAHSFTSPLETWAMTKAAFIISWNLFQMDGLTYQTPNVGAAPEVPTVHFQAPQREGGACPEVWVAEWLSEPLFEEQKPETEGDTMPSNTSTVKFRRQEREANAFYKSCPFKDLLNSNNHKNTLF